MYYMHLVLISNTFSDYGYIDYENSYLKEGCLMFNKSSINYYVWDHYWRIYRINSEAAVQIALQQVPGQVVKVELEFENGILVYEVDIRTISGVYEIHIHAITGQILKVEQENYFD